MAGSQADEHCDHPSDHGGRQRSFPHERGNWASHVYITADAFLALPALVQDLLRVVPVHLDFNYGQGYHLSLSKTFVVRHHWIKDLQESLSQRLSSSVCCDVCFDGVDVLVNDEKSRSFLVLKVSSGSESLVKLVANVDSVLEEYNLPTYYEEPSFHVSLAWALGDVTEKISTEILSQLQSACAEFLRTNPHLSLVRLKTVVCKTSNRSYRIHLKDS